MGSKLIRKGFSPIRVKAWRIWAKVGRQPVSNDREHEGAASSWESRTTLHITMAQARAPKNIIARGCLRTHHLDWS